jgi:hypothetical protein
MSTVSNDIGMILIYTNIKDPAILMQLGVIADNGETWNKIIEANTLTLNDLFSILVVSNEPYVWEKILNTSVFQKLQNINILIEKAKGKNNYKFWSLLFGHPLLKIELVIKLQAENADINTILTDFTTKYKIDQPSFWEGLVFNKSMLTDPLLLSTIVENINTELICLLFLQKGLIDNPETLVSIALRHPKSEKIWEVIKSFTKQIYEAKKEEDPQYNRVEYDRA